MLNSIIIMGRLTADPVVRQTNSGIPVASFTVAVDRDKAAADGKKEVDFIDCVAWRKTAEFVGSYFFKGKPILVQGRLQSRDWTDKEGKKRRNWEVVANQIEFCGGEKKSPVSGPTAVDGVMESTSPVMTDLDLGDDDLPWEDHDLK